MGKRWRYIYKLYKDGVLVEEGTQTEILAHHLTSPSNLYCCWKNKQKFMREYRVEREIREWKPKQNEEYFYCSHMGIIKDYFDINNFTCLSRFHAKNCFETKEVAKANYYDTEARLKRFYENS